MTTPWTLHLNPNLNMLQQVRHAIHTVLSVSIRSVCTKVQRLTRAASHQLMTSFSFRMFSSAFPNKVIILAGDTRQLAPVVINGAEADTTAASVLSSSFYRDNASVFHLTRTMRNRGDPDFSKMVDDIGDGTYPVGDDGFTIINNVQTVTSIGSAIDFVFPEDILANPEECSKRSIISLHNVSVDRINDFVLERVPGESYLLQGSTTLDHEHAEGEVDDAFAMSDFLSHMSQSGVPQNTIHLKKGVVVMLCRNLSLDERLTNGTKVLVLDISTHVLRIQTLDEQRTIHILPRIAFSFITWQGVAVKRVQFPIRLSFCVTVHRAQGLTLDRCCVDFTLDPFTHGHVYVALSRVRMSSDLLILTSPDRIDSNGNAKVLNIVFNSLLPEVPF